MARGSSTYSFIFTDKDVKEELKEKYPDLNIDKLCNDVFTALIKRMIVKGSATITNLGRFKGYVIQSTKLNKKVYRTKFIFSYYFIKRIREDSYLINNIEEKEQVKFNPETLTKRSEISYSSQLQYNNLDRVKNSIADIIESFDSEEKNEK